MEGGSRFVEANFYQRSSQCSSVRFIPRTFEMATRSSYNDFANYVT